MTLPLQKHRYSPDEIQELAVQASQARQPDEDPEAPSVTLTELARVVDRVQDDLLARLVLTGGDSENLPSAYANPQAFRNFEHSVAPCEWMWAGPGDGRDLEPLYRESVVARLRAELVIARGFLRDVYTENDPKGDLDKRITAYLVGPSAPSPQPWEKDMDFRPEELGDPASEPMSAMAGKEWTLDNVGQFMINHLLDVNAENFTESVFGLTWKGKAGDADLVLTAQLVKGKTPGHIIEDLRAKLAIANAEKAALARVKQYAWGVMQEALSSATVHPRDEHSEEVRVGTLSTAYQKLYTSLTSSTVPVVEVTAPSEELRSLSAYIEDQWWLMHLASVQDHTGVSTILARACRIAVNVVQATFARLAKLETAPKGEWRDMGTAPKDGTIVELLVQYTENNFDDEYLPQQTIGTNAADMNGIDEWLFSGWNWEQDCFTQGSGEALKWRPFLEPQQQVQASEPAPEQQLQSTSIPSKPTQTVVGMVYGGPGDPKGIGEIQVVELFPETDCPLCHDIGFIPADDPIDAPMTMQACPYCKKGQTE